LARKKTILIDTHCHIYLPDFDTELDAVLDRAATNGVTDILMPAIDFSSEARMKRLHHARITFHRMSGVHPCEIHGDRCNLEASLLASCAGNEVVGIGETGLDYHWSTDHIEEQQKSLRMHCKVAKTLGKPVVLHNRKATDDLLRIIEDEQDGSLTGVWHCFNGTPDEGRRAIDLGLYLGIGGVATFKNAGVDKTLKELPLSSMILETDAPYLTPHPHRGKRNEPGYVKLVAKKMSRIFDLSLEEIDRATTSAAVKLFPLIRN